MNIKKYGRTGLVMEKAEQFIRDCHDGQTAVLLIRSLWSYLNHLDGFNESAFDLADESLPAYVWWSEFRCDPKHAALKSLAIRLLHIPATSATAERNWSAFRFIHSRLRNRLVEERVQKLVYVFGNSKLVEKGQYLEDDDIEFFTSISFND